MKKHSEVLKNFIHFLDSYKKQLSLCIDDIERSDNVNDDQDIIVEVLEAIRSLKSNLDESNLIRAFNRYQRSLNND